MNFHIHERIAMDNKDLYDRIAQLERQLRTAKEEEKSALERSETLRQMLMEVNNEFLNMLSNSNMGAMCLDLELRIQSVTPGIQELFHIRRQDIGRPLTDLASNLIYDNLAPDARDVIATSELKEVVIPSKNGRWFDMRISPNVLDNGEVIGVVISLADITHLKTKESELTDKSERILNTINRSPIVVWNQDTHLRYTWIHNPHPDFNPNDVIGKTDDEMLPPDEATILKKIKQKVLDTGIATRDKVTTTIQGTTYYYDLSVQPLTDEKANVVGISCASMEISKDEYDLLKPKRK
jgi:two-component system CheB/CheR fusion protein